MGIIYKILGIFASMNETLSRQSINFIPLNVGLMIAAGAGTLFAGVFFMTTLTEGRTFKNVQLQDVLDHKHEQGQYIIVKGRLIPKLGMEYVSTNTKTGSKTIDNAFAPMIDAKSGRIIYVDLEGKDLKARTNGMQEIKGKLTSIHSELRKELAKDKKKFRKIKFDMEYMIAEGEEPGNPIVSGLLLLGAGSVFLGFLWTSMKKYTIFRASGDSSESYTPPAADKEIETNITGWFRLDGKSRRYFNNMPAVPARMETGELSFLSNIDASSNFMGFQTKERKGIWHVTIAPDSISKMERGILYYGFKERPSIRVHYTDVSMPNKPKVKAIVSCRRENEREAVMREIQTGGTPSIDFDS